MLPEPTREIILGVPDNRRHPGIQLDKLSVAGRQEDQATALKKVCDAARDEKLLAELLARRALLFDESEPSPIQFDAVTSSPLTLHLARASALENAGLCLHPLYGFAYLPGSGLKGKARAYAETVWTSSCGNTTEAWSRIERVFGWAPRSEKGKRWRPDIPIPEGASTGSIVFHDAWPRRWPRLFVDIVNNHHGKYYSGEGPPGDWEEPVPVYFLAVQPPAAFSFALSPRRSDSARNDLELARDFLIGGLTWLGAGAKTTSGYGCFKLAGETVVFGADAPAPAPLVSETFELELITPAFLAGASQSRDDCDLRPATLRGLLRWWWRTMHAGFVSTSTLRKLEAVVWGDTAASGSVRISIQPAMELAPTQFDKQTVRVQHGLEPTSDNKTTQGVWYHSYGMDEKKGGRRSQRYFAPPGIKWRVTLTARPCGFQRDPSDPKSQTVVAAQRIMEQAKAALWLLCHFGGVGSKARKGFGSFDEPQALAHFSVPQCEKLAVAFRQDCGFGAGSFNQYLAETPTLQQLLPWHDMPLAWSDCWYALDQIGYAAQEFAKKYIHQPKKKALGLPRAVKEDKDGFQPSPPVTNRHSSPIHYHLASNRKGGGLILRVAAFPAARLPNIESSRSMLSELLSHLKHELERRVSRRRNGSQPPPRSEPPAQAPSPFIPKTPRGGRSQPPGRSPKRR